MFQTFADRLRYVIGDDGKDYTPWALARGLAPATLEGWLNKGMKPYPKSLAKLVAATGIPDWWWMSGHEPPPPVVTEQVAVYSVKPVEATAGLARLDADTPPDQFALVPYYDVRASAGYGAFVADDPAIRHFAFDREWLARHIGVSARRLALIPVSGTSMEPDLHDGDLVMIDRGDIERLREGIYVFELDGSLYVKRLALRGERLAIESTNGNFAPVELNTLQDNPGFRLHGRVIGSPSFRRF